MESLRERLACWVGHVVVVDCISPFAIAGKLASVGNDYLELHDADMHDLRDSDTNRELYLVKTKRLGVQATRSALLLRLGEVVGVSRLEDVLA